MLLLALASTGGFNCASVVCGLGPAVVTAFAMVLAAMMRGGVVSDYAAYVIDYRHLAYSGAVREAPCSAT